MDGLPYPFAIEMLDHYAEFPPLSVLKKMELGYKGPDQVRSEQSQEEKIAAMRRLKHMNRKDRTIGMRRVSELPKFMRSFIDDVRSGVVKRAG